MSYIKRMVPKVWGTKSREPVLTSEKRKLLFAHKHHRQVTFVHEYEKFNKSYEFDLAKAKK